MIISSNMFQEIFTAISFWKDYKPSKYLF